MVGIIDCLQTRLPLLSPILHMFISFYRSIIMGVCTFLKNMYFQNSAYYFLNLFGSYKQSPWSSITIWNCLLFRGWGRTNTFPGWGSQWTNPVMKIWSAKALINLFMIYFLLYPNLFNYLSSVIFMPSIHYDTITLSRVN